MFFLSTLAHNTLSRWLLTAGVFLFLTIPVSAEPDKTNLKNIKKFWKQIDQNNLCKEDLEAIRITEKTMVQLEDLGTTGNIGKINAYHITGKKKRAFVFFQAEDPEEDLEELCVVFPVGKAAARKQGSFWTGETKVKAFVLEEPRCNEENCLRAVVIRTLEGKILSAYLLNAFCEIIEKFKGEKIFSDTNKSMLMRCITEAGAGFAYQSTLIMHVIDNKIRLLLTVETGTYTEDAPSEAEEKGDYCTSSPAGWIKVIKTGKEPVIDVMTPTDNEHNDFNDSGEEGVGELTRYRYSKKHKKLIPEGKKKQVTFDNKAECIPFDPQMWQ